jgi:hypothetical protein
VATPTPIQQARNATTTLVPAKPDGPLGRDTRPFIAGSTILFGARPSPAAGPSQALPASASTRRPSGPATNLHVSQGYHTLGFAQTGKNGQSPVVSPGPSSASGSSGQSTSGRPAEDNRPAVAGPSTRVNKWDRRTERVQREAATGCRQVG